jgi:hypothetical protein
MKMHLFQFEEHHFEIILYSESPVQAIGFMTGLDKIIEENKILLQLMPHVSINLFSLLENELIVFTKVFLFFLFI